MPLQALHNIRLRFAALLPIGGLGGALVFILLLAACHRTPSDQLRLKGHFDHLQQAQIFIYSDSPLFCRVDTIQVVGGDFDYRCHLSEPTVLTIVYPNFSETLLVGEPGQTLRYKADVSNLRHAEIKGSTPNDSLSAFRQRYAAEPLERQQKAAEKYIRQHPNDWAALALFQHYFERAECYHKEPLSSLLSALVKAHPQHQGLQALKQRITPILHTAVGAKAPELLPEKGKPALLIFTLNSQMLSGQMRAIAKRLTEERNDIAYEDICADNRDFDSLRTHYGIRYIPSNLLLDAKGCVKARDIAPNQIEKELKRLLH